MNDACNHIDVRVIAVKGSVRSSKTLSAESMLLRNLTYGPLGNILWFMQDNDSLNDYVDERGEEMLAIHPEVFEKIDWDDSRNTSRKRKRIGMSRVLWRPTTQRALRGMAAQTLVGGGLDA